MNKATLCVLVLSIVFAVAVRAEDTFYARGLRDAFDVYRECSKSEGFSPCLKKKAIGYLDRLGRMSKIAIDDGVTLTHEVDNSPAVTEEQLDAALPRALDAKDAALSNIAVDKVSSLLGSSNIQISLRRFLDEDDEGTGVEESRKKKGGKKGMMGDIGMLLMAKMAALLPIKIAIIGFIAKKALIIAKIALLLSGIIAVKKLLGSKGGSGGGGGHGGGYSSGHGGWSSSGGGWDKRSMDDAQNLAYSAYSPQ